MKTQQCYSSNILGFIINILHFRALKLSHKMKEICVGEVGDCYLSFNNLVIYFEFVGVNKHPFIDLNYILRNSRSLNLKDRSL